MYSVKVLTDSINTWNIRLTTLEITYPRIVHAEFMTHRVFSRNAASNRAIPGKKLISMVESEPFIPLTWPMEQKGMVGGDVLDYETSTKAIEIWINARDDAVTHAKRLAELGIHKSLPNRLLEPFQWITVIVTATEWGNWFNLRNHDDAEQHIRKLAEMMLETMELSEPKLLKPGEWHLPYISEEDRIEIPDLAKKLINYEEKYRGNDASEFLAIYTGLTLAKISAARTARVSYLNHGGGRDLEQDIQMCEGKLIVPGHWSPLEHPCVSQDSREWRGNVRGWKQLRKFYPQESNRVYVG